MNNHIGIKREDKNPWERRVPLAPEDVGKLVAEGVEISFEPCDKRAFNDQAYREVGAVPSPELTDCDVVIGIKEMRKDVFRPGKTYVFFSHTHKGQPYTMPMLAKLSELGCTLIDYELMTNDAGQRLIFFSVFAGYAGMIDTLHTVGRRLTQQGVASPFSAIRPTHEYTDLQDAKDQMIEVGRAIATGAIPAELRPFVVGITGYGNVSQGAQEILDLLPHVSVAPKDLETFVRDNPDLADRVVKVVYREEDLVRQSGSGVDEPFDLQHYYAHGELYESIFEPHLHLLNVLVNGIFWTEKYPRLASAEQLRRIFGPGVQFRSRLNVVGDISCDIDGSLACTVRDTTPGDPVYIYNPEDGTATPGFEGDGLAVMAVGNLPCELPVEASTAFSEALAPFAPSLASFKQDGSIEESGLPPELKRAIILWKGKLTSPHRHLQQFI